MSKFKPKDFEMRATVPCAHDGCGDPAILSKKLPTGIANLCRKHYEFHTQQEANEFCKANGLGTREQKRDWIKSHMPNFSMNAKSREPGEEG